MTFPGCLLFHNELQNSGSILSFWWLRNEGNKTPTKRSYFMRINKLELFSFSLPFNTHTCTHTTHTCTHTPMIIFALSFNTHMHTHNYSRTHKGLHMQWHTRTLSFTLFHKDLFACMHTRIYTFFTHTHTHVCARTLAHMSKRDNRISGSHMNPE